MVVYNGEYTTGTCTIAMWEQPAGSPGRRHFQGGGSIHVQIKYGVNRSGLRLTHRYGTLGPLVMSNA